MVKSKEVSWERGRTIFLDEIGYSAKGRVLDYLLTGRELEYSKTDIANGSGANRLKVFGIINSLIKKNQLIPSKKVKHGVMGIQLYKLNENNDIVKALINLENAILRNELKRGIKNAN